MPPAFSELPSRRIAYAPTMKNGILKETDGFDLVVDGRNRTFRDVYGVALDAARELKRLNRNSRIQIRTRADGSIREMLEDGRIR
jgi:hypothetical protein